MIAFIAETCRYWLIISFGLRAFKGCTDTLTSKKYRVLRDHSLVLGISFCFAGSSVAVLIIQHYCFINTTPSYEALTYLLSNNAKLTYLLQFLLPDHSLQRGW